MAVISIFVSHKFHIKYKKVRWKKRANSTHVEFRIMHQLKSSLWNVLNEKGFCVCMCGITYLLYVLSISVCITHFPVLLTHFLPVFAGAHWLTPSAFVSFFEMNERGKCCCCCCRCFCCCCWKCKSLIGNANAWKPLVLSYALGKFGEIHTGIERARANANDMKSWAII